MESLKPKLRFPEFNDDYKSVKFNDIISNSGYGPRFNGDDYDVNGNVKTIRGTDIDLNGEIKYSQVPTASLNENFIKNHILVDGDLVMITTADCGLTGVFKKQETNYIPSAYAFKISLNEKANPYYYKYFFQTKIATNQVNRFVRKATVANLPGSDILKFDIKLTNINEQNKIATFLSEVDSKINQLTKKKEQLDLYKKGVMQKIFNQELRFNDNENKIFPNWEIVKLSSICEYKNGGSFENYVCKDGIYNLISLNSIDINGKIKKEHKKVSISDNSLKKGDLIMVLSDVAHGNFLGLTDIVPGDNFVLNQRMGALKPIKVVNTFYLKTFINFNQKYFKKKGQGSSQLNLSKGDVLNFSIKLPCISEQNKIANFLSAIEDKIEQVNFQLENTIYFKKALLQEMFI